MRQDKSSISISLPLGLQSVCNDIKSGWFRNGNVASRYCYGIVYHMKREPDGRHPMSCMTKSCSCILVRRLSSQVNGRSANGTGNIQ
jgi:hypothetical protein